ncbi:MAG: hypothetical protein ACKV0T_15100 [Planctomycetales bacterium]
MAVWYGLTVEGSADDGGYYTLLIEGASGKQRMFTMSQSDEIKHLVALLKRHRDLRNA